MKGGDFSTPAVATNSGSSLNAWEEYQVTAAIKEIVENKGVNNGLLLKFDSKTPKHGVCFRSSESSQTAQRPKLVITYDDPNTPVLPFSSEKLGIPAMVTITDLQGKRIALFVAGSPYQLNHIKNSIAKGVHIVSVSTPGKKRIEKILGTK